jgi:alkanesulfonate monooxygenase SsuD/methylene tetrahydromethanopterin reductase-like flavin-dependent oxidoreductase (luciferase family)
MTAVSISVEGTWGLTWPLWKELVAATERLEFACLYQADHFDGIDPIASLTHAAGNTERVSFGPLVAPVSFRDPVMLARQALALDDLSGGRMVLGLGAGWNESEHTMFGYDLGDLDTRFARFGEALEVITRLLRSDAPTSFEGQYYRLKDAILLPRPQRAGGPPILVGGSGPKRTLPLAARYADIWNATRVSPDTFRERCAQLDELVRAAGRRPEDVRRTVTFCPFCGTDAAELERRLSWARLRDPKIAALSLEAFVTTFTPPGVFVGSPSELAALIHEYAAAGADEVMLQWVSMDDIEGLEVLAEQVVPLVA